MKIDRYTKVLSSRLDSLSLATANGNGGGNGNGNGNNGGIDNFDDDYYLAIGSQPPRFQAYRHARWEKLDEWGKLTCEDTDETITQDELDFGLKRWLSKTPEQRYQEEREEWYSHESSSRSAGLSIDDIDKRCNDQRCLPTDMSVLS